MAGGYQDKGVAKMRKEGIVSRTTRYRRERQAALFGCSVEELPDTRGKHGNQVSKDKHPRWNNGITISSHRYIKIQVGKDHPCADPNGYAYLHHLVWISSGRQIPNNMVIHHVNGNTKDNRIENITIKTSSDHIRDHNKERSGELVKMPTLDGKQWAETPGEGG